MSSYIKGLFHGLGTLLTGMKVTGREFFTKKVTEQYPENRATLKMFDRFCGELTMPHDAEGRNKCIACGLCQSACPNGTIRLTTETVVDPETGKSKKRLARYEYDLGSCMFCRLDPFRACGLHARKTRQTTQQTVSHGNNTRTHRIHGPGAVYRR